MQRSGPRGPKRSPTPTSATFPNATSIDSAPPISPSASAQGTQKPLYLCSPFVEAALVKGNFKTIVMLPKYVDIMEWVAVNSCVYNLLLSAFTALLTARPPVINIKSLTFSRTLICFMELYLNAAHNSPVQPCPPDPRECSIYTSCISRIINQAICAESLNYTWINQDRKSVQLPAPTYIDYVMTWVQNLLDDENTFPTKSGISNLSHPLTTYLTQTPCPALVYQDRTSPPRFRRPSNTYTVSSCACLRTYTTHITPRFFTYVPNRISTRSSHISSRLAVSTSCLRSKTFVARPTRRLSASALCGSAGEK
jgi:Mob1/phocein family